MIPIEKGVPLPEPNTTARNTRKYPIREMEVGDSFRADVKANTLRSVVYAASRGMKRKYRYAPDGDGTRVWRVE